MPAVIDISNSRSPKKNTGKAPPKRGPKPAVLIALGICIVIAGAFAIHYMMTSGADSHTVAPYDSPRKRSVSGPGGGPAGGGGTGSKVAPGLPGDGG